MVWLEVKSALDANRCELILSGPQISKRIDDDNGIVDETMFELSKLNLLEISRTNLKSLPDRIGKLTNLTNLSLHGNQLESIPIELSKLRVLKHLDLSRNKISRLPDAFHDMNQLLTLNVSSNLLEDLPDIKGLLHLTVLDISHNKFKEFPRNVVVYEEKRGKNDPQPLVRLGEVRARGNLIERVPSTIGRCLPSLKLLDVEENQVKTVAGELGDCAKLKDIGLKGNPLEDRRLKKLVENNHSASSKPILDYIRSNCTRDADATNGIKTDKKKTNKKKKAKDKEDENEEKLDFIQVLKTDDTVPSVCVSDAVQRVRPYIACCILKRVNLKDASKFRKFISLQTKLHENICKKRTVATIATHDLAKIGGKQLLYDARPPSDIKITPLSRQTQMTASELFAQVQKEAEAVRKEKKRNTYSGVHKFLYLIEGKELFPCLCDGVGQVVSFPPITNSDATKITSESVDVFIEVTSSVSLGSCKEVLDSLIHEVATNVCIYEDDRRDVDGTEISCRLVVQQVKVVDSQGQLKVLYPSQTDLQFSDLDIHRL